MRTGLYVVGFALLFGVASDLVIFAIPDVGSTTDTVLGGVALVAGGVYGWRRAHRTGTATEARVGEARPRRAIALRSVLLLHGFGALMWFAFLGFSSDYAGTDRQFLAATAFGLVTWLAATAFIVWLWRSGRMSFWVPFAWWYPSFLLMIAVVYGW